MSDKLPESEAAKSEAMDSALSAKQDSGQETQMESPLEETAATEDETKEAVQHSEPAPTNEAANKAEQATVDSTSEPEKEVDLESETASMVKPNTEAENTEISSDIVEEAQPEPTEPVRFQELALPEPLLKAITKLGFEECTPIQGQALPFSLSDYDVTGQAQTGTGKTAAFLITLFTRFWEYPLQQRPNLGTPRALVLAPTRELALQIEGDAEGLNRYMDMRTVCVVGGMDFDRQRAELMKGPVDILVATPGRLIDFLDRRDINLSGVECLVIDEADRMLDMGFIPDVRRIVYQTPHKRKRQTLLFSATFNDAVMRLADSWTVDPEHIVIEPESVATDTVEQKFWLVESSKRQKILLDFIKHAEPQRAIIFANRRDRTHELVEFLKKNQISCEGLAGDIPQKKRLSTLSKFKNEELKYLIATDVAGRGIHVDGVTHVINFELPDDAEDYVHRIGRTGRAGSTGTAISFVSEDDAFNLPALEEYLGAPIQCIQPDLLPDDSE